MAGTENFGLILISIGIFIIIFGIVWYFGGKYIGLGKLPGDFSYSGKNVNIYAPIASSIIISIVLSILLTILLRFLYR